MDPQKLDLTSAPRLFNFAIGFFIPPAFASITWKLFIIFGTLCFGAAIQAFLTYPETAGKTLEEIEILFRPDGPRPWHTKPGNSLFDQKLAEIRQHGGKDDAVLGAEQRLEYAEKTGTDTSV
jgi:hypothetical protein